MFTLLTSLLLFSVSFPIHAAKKEKCASGELRIREMGEVKVIKSRFCTDKTGTVLVSEPFRDEVALGKRIPPSQSVNPGWVFCDSLGASPELVEIHIKGNWYELDRCVFKDGTYIDTGSLFELGIQD